jgi:protein O-mannosyl-transferase
MLVPMTLAVLTSLNTLQNGFVHDDTSQVLNNSFITDLGNLPLAFTSSVWSFLTENIRSLTDVYFRPMFTAQFMINYAIFGTAAWGWHLANVLIHAAVSVLVFVILKEMTGRNWLALATACFFAVHPVHAESVAWISGLTDPLMTLFFLIAFLCFLRFQKNGRKYLIAFSVAFYLLAMLAKETALVLPALIAYHEFFYKQDLPLRRRAIRVAAFVGVYTLPTLFYFFLRYQALGGAVTGEDSQLYPLTAALLTIPSAVVKYISLMLVPINYNFQHYTPFGSVTSLSFIASSSGLLIATAGIFLARSRDLAFAAVWFLLALTPVLAALRLLHPIASVQERYLYLPSIGACFAVMLGVEWLANRKLLSTGFGRIAILAIPVAIIIVFGAINIEQNLVWHDNITMFRRCVIVNPQSAFARNALASIYWLSGKHQEAEAEARAAIDLDPTCTDAYVNLCYFARASGKLEQAVKYLQQAKSSLPEGPERRFFLGRVHHDLGLLYGEQKKLDLAEENLRTALEVLPTLPHEFDLAEFYFDHGRYNEALEMFEEIGRRVPAWFAPIHLRLARTYDRLNQPERARPEYKKYLELSPAARERDEVRKRLSQL